MIRRRVVVEGVVQGVGFRVSVVSRARRVAGWVRNLPDGRVEAVFEGSPADVDALVAFCRDGPRGAVVRSVEVVDEEPEGFSSFEMR